MPVLRVDDLGREVDAEGRVIKSTQRVPKSTLINKNEQVYIFEKALYTRPHQQRMTSYIPKTHTSIHILAVKQTETDKIN